MATGGMASPWGLHVRQARGWPEFGPRSPLASPQRPTGAIVGSPLAGIRLARAQDSQRLGRAR